MMQRPHYDRSCSGRLPQIHLGRRPLSRCKARDNGYATAGTRSGQSPQHVGQNSIIFYHEYCAFNEMRTEY
jgi:hypothetical protein